jgi:2-iminobutanoate/2-iminopropanoate deaminase
LISRAASGQYRGLVAARTVIQTVHAPAAVGPYSQAIIDGDKVFLSGQIPLDPATGKLVEGDIATQTRRVLDNVKAVLEAAGSNLAAVCKTTVFVTDLKHFAELNRTYGEYFSAAPPARSTVQVAALPLGAQVEIEVIASITNSTGV